MTDNTINARNRALRKRRRDAGMIRFERWIPADKLQAVKDAIDQIVNSEQFSWQGYSDYCEGLVEAILENGPLDTPFYRSTAKIVGETND